MYQITESDIQKALAEVLSKQVFLPNVSPDSIMIRTDNVGQFYRITARLGSNYQVLPTPKQIIKNYNQTGQKGIGAKWLMFGAVQIVGDRLRVTIRIVQTETSQIARATKGDGENNYEGLKKAFEIAIIGLNIAYVC